MINPAWAKLYSGLVSTLPFMPPAEESDLLQTLQVTHTKVAPS